jgi:hypothetical protein
MRLLLASIAVTLATAVGCGGRVTTLGPGGDQQDSGSEGDDGGPTEDVVTIDTYAPPPFDSGPIYEDAPIVVEDAGSCLVDLEPCIGAYQCCSGVCTNGTCGDVAPPPSCVPDGYGCNGSPPCCSGPCINGVCGEVVDAGPPVTCSAPAGNQCFDCLAAACCPQLAACEADTVCTESLACFEGCFTPGSGLTCSQKCDAAYPSPFEQPLTSCATNLCLSSCQ